VSLPIPFLMSQVLLALSANVRKVGVWLQSGKVGVVYFVSGRADDVDGEYRVNAEERPRARFF